MSEEKVFVFSPIGYIRSENQYRFEAPRQAVYSKKGAFLEFLPDDRFAVAAADLRGFSYVWIIFCFHLNLGKEWKPKVRPPVSADGGRYGVFSTRSPHRPNPIGMSCVALSAIEKRGLLLGPCDLLDGTPVLDVKPYIPEADAFPAARTGWRDSIRQENFWQVSFSDRAREKASWIHQTAGLDLLDFCALQLGYEPLNAKRKRVRALAESEGLYSIGCRTWRCVFTLDRARHGVVVSDILSNYLPEELLPGMPDPYADKDFHRAFLRQAW